MAATSVLLNTFEIRNFKLMDVPCSKRNGASHSPFRPLVQSSGHRRAAGYERIENVCPSVWGRLTLKDDLSTS